MPHPALPLLDPFTGRTVSIDVEMVPVISSLWTLGMETLSCCQGESAETTAQIREVAMQDPVFRAEHGARVDAIFPPDAYPAVICFAGVGRGYFVGRFRKSRQHASRLAMMLHDVAPDDRWRAWRWNLDEGNWASAVVFPNEALPWLAAQLARLERVAGGQLTIEEAISA